MSETEPPLDASLTVFCQNEAGRIGDCIASLAAASTGRRVHLTIVANGSSDNSGNLARQAAVAAGLPVSLYAIAHGDKANAINHALHGLLRPARLHVFADGYAIVSADTLSEFARVLQQSPRAVAATGVAGNGRTMQAATAETLTKGGRLHGQLHAFTPGFLARLRAMNLRLPIGLYRGDGLLGSMACHDLDPIGQTWDGHRIAGAADAVYMIPQLSPFRASDVARQFRRKIRQMRGLLENAAIKSLIYKGGYAALPDFADDMIAAWLAEGHQPSISAADRPFMALALRQHRRATRPLPADLEPGLVA